MGIKHTKVSAIPDDANTSKVRASDWNDDHTIDGEVDFNGHAIVNVDLSGLDLEGQVEFTELTDVPNSYAGSAGKIPTVNAGETGLEFTTPSVGGDSILDWVTPQQFGAVADGSSHPLSEFYGSLAAAQAAYDGALFFITSLTQEADYAGCKAASNECFGPDTVAPAGDGFITPGDFLLCGAGTTALDNFSFFINDGEPDLVPNELVGANTLAFVAYASSPGFVATSQVVSNTTRQVTCSTLITLSDTSMYAFGQGENGVNTALNKPLYMPAGTYEMGNDVWTIRNLASGIIQGSGKLATVLQGGGEAVLRFDGFWYSRLADMSINQYDNTSICALDLDGNVPGHAYDTRSVQGSLLQNLSIDAGMATYGFALCRQGGGSGQGSEMVYVNLHLYNAAFSCYYQNGFNALANSFIGCNFQYYIKHGAYVIGGTCGFFNTGFQSVELYQQFLNDGWDISIGASGAFEGVPIIGCRTESPWFLQSGAVTVDVRACVGATCFNQWSAATAFSTAVFGREWIRVTSSIDGSYLLMVATTAGTSHATTEPTWNVLPNSGGTVNDNTVVWKECSSATVSASQRQFIFINAALGRVDYASCSGRDGGQIIAQPPTGLLEDVTGATSATNLLPAFRSMGKFVASTAAGSVTIPVPIGRRGGNSQSGRSYFIGRGDETNDVTVALSDFGGLYKRALTLTHVLPKMIGGQTWVSRENSADALGGWVLQSSLYLGDMTANMITDLNGNELVEFAQASTAADNHVKITNADTTTPPKIEATGSDTNVDLQLAGKGTGLVRYGVHQAIAGETLSGYITIKDEAGNPRKIAVVV